MSIEALEKIAKGAHSVIWGADLKKFTTFGLGGPAQLMLFPRSKGQLLAALQEASSQDVPVFILGGGANVVFPDQGWPGLVISTSKLRSFSYNRHQHVLHASAGASISDIALFGARHRLQGFENFYRLPGTLGGALIMNARCYGAEIKDLVLSVSYITKDLDIVEDEPIKITEWGYKSSPLRKRAFFILSAALKAQKSSQSRQALLTRARELERDRENKHHFSFPSAGSMFKNSRNLGAPTGQLLDSLGLRGYQLGTARISPYHANIFTRCSKNGTQADLEALVSLAERRAKEHLGATLEREVIFVRPPKELLKK